MASFAERMIGAAMLNVATYEEVEHDTTATGQAAAVVALVAVAQAIGQANNGVLAMVFGVLGALLGWLAWSAVTYVIGVSLFGGRADWGEMLRTIGFAQTPGLLMVLGAIPVLGGLVGFVAAIWMLVAAVIAIRQALDVSTGKAIGTALVGLVVYIMVWIVLGLIGAVFGVAVWGLSSIF